MTNLINIENKDGSLIVSSREIASNFEKEHTKVVRDIENLIEGIAKNGDTYNHLLMEGEYQNEQNKQIYKEYLLTRDGFTLLAMGFTGQKALQWKLKYIEAFNKMEKALQEVYHISETAIVNNVMDHLESKFFPQIDERLKKYEENYRPTHANKIDLNRYIKKALGEFAEDEEVDLVKERVLYLLNAKQWQDIPYEKFKQSMHLIDESIRAVKSFRSKVQISLFED